MNTDFFSQLVIRLIDLEETIEETMYFSLASSLIGETTQLKELSLPSFLLGKVRHVVASSLYFEHSQNRKQKVLRYFSEYANSYSLIKLTAAWEEFMLECHIVMEMAKTNDYGITNEAEIREEIRNKNLGSKNGVRLLKELDKLYQLEITKSKEYSIISSIYRLRDCIAHRNGIVSVWDLDKNEKFMTTIWREALVKNNKKTISAWALTGESKFQVLYKYKNKQWIKNEVIVLKDTEICDIGLSLIDIANLVFNKLVDQSKSMNLN